MSNFLRALLTCLALAFAASAAGTHAPVPEQVSAAKITAVALSQDLPKYSALSQDKNSIVRYKNISNLELSDPCGLFGKLFGAAIGIGSGLAGSNGNSFEADTLVHTRVLTDTGHQTVLKPIANIQIGDEILAWDEPQAHDNAAVLKQTILQEKEALSQREYSLFSYENNSNLNIITAKATTFVSAKAVTPAPSAQRYEKVTDLFSSSKQQTLLHISLDNGQTLQATSGNPFKTADGWCDAVLLKKGGQLLLKGGDGCADSNANANANANANSDTNSAERYATITDIRKEVKTTTVFNLEVANLHTFFVGAEGLVMHNAKNTGTYKDKSGG